MTKLFCRATALCITVLFWALCASIIKGPEPVYVFNYAFAAPAVGAIIGLGVFTLAYKFRHALPQGVLAAGIYMEVWTGELVKQFNSLDQVGWMQGIRDYSQYANNNVIHLVDVGADPDVLINNTTYPIAVQDLGDGDITISLDKYQTKATRITDDELYAISYDKIALKREQHGTAIANVMHKKAIHAMAPAANTVNTPVLVTTGENDGTGRKRLVRADIVALKKAFDDAKFPLTGRRLVLCSDHISDLLLTDQKFADQYYNYTTGKISNLLSFEVYEYVENPFFVIGAKTKLAYGGLPVAGTHSQASVAFLPAEMFKAKGTTKGYASKAEDNPLTQENLINFRQYFITLPKKQRAIGAVISGLAA